MQIFRSKKLKIAGAGLVAAVAFLGLIRCVPSDQAVITDDAVSEKVKEAEAAEEAEAQAMKVAHGEDDADPAHAAPPKHEAKAEKAHAAPPKHEAKAEKEHAAAPKHEAKAEKAHAAPPKHEAKAEHAPAAPPKHEAKAEKAHAAPPKHETKAEPKKEAAESHPAPKAAAWGKPAAAPVAKHDEPKHVERAPASKPAAGAGYVVQVGAFKVKENAEKLTAKLKGAGYTVHMESISHSKNGDLHVVRLEPVATKAAALESVAELKSKESLNAAVIKASAAEKSTAETH